MPLWTRQALHKKWHPKAETDGETAAEFLPVGDGHHAVRGASDRTTHSISFQSSPYYPRMQSHTKLCEKKAGKEK